MKKFFLALAVLALCPFLAAGEGARGLTGEDFLTASGKYLQNKKGGRVVLRGVNAGGWLLQEFWMSPVERTKNVRAESDARAVLAARFGKQKAAALIGAWQDSFWTTEDFDNCSRLGMNCVRLPFWHKNIVGEDGEFLPDAFGRLDWFVKEAGERGLYVILDFHGAPGSQNGRDHSGIDGGSDKKRASRFFFGEDAEQNQELFYKIWEAIAAACAVVSGSTVVAA